MTAVDVVNSINETELTVVLRRYGQEKEAGYGQSLPKNN